MLTQGWTELITPEYERLSKLSQDLRAEGVASYDLRRVYATTEETVYVDSCCHLNELGLRLLGEAIADRVLGSGELTFPRAEK